MNSYLDLSAPLRTAQQAARRYQQDPHAAGLLEDMRYIVSLFGSPRMYLSLIDPSAPVVLDVVFPDHVALVLLHRQYMLEAYQRDSYPELFAASATPSWL